MHVSLGSPEAKIPVQMVYLEEVEYAENMAGGRRGVKWEYGK